MPLRTRTWFIISALCFLAAAIFWQLAERKSARDKAARDNAAAATNAPASPGTPGAAPANPSVATNAATAIDTNDPLRFRLSNTTKSVGELSHSDQALLLRNAHIDSAIPANLPIPPHLRSQGDPGSYVVQARGPLTDAYRAALQQAGAEVVAYVPNNAYLVRASQAAAQQLATLPATQVVLPWEPYYKFDTDLLELAVEQKPLPPNTRLNLLLFPGQRAQVMQALDAMEATILGEDRSPFGPQLQVRPPADSLVPLASLAGVQVIERIFPRKLANDLSRERVRVTANTLKITPNYRNLTGEGVLVNVNDTGVWAQHPDLSPRVSGDSAFTLEDFDGHGTHVAGTIASSGLNGPTIPPRLVPGSVTNADFRGIAPEAKIFALPLNRTFGPDLPDTYYQENAAATNAFISNNSWGYSGSRDYNLASASWDAAVRDALPGVTGSQPLLAVFAAGNSGGAGIDAPATAKNVITVGAIENLRLITNEVVKGAPPNQVTNQPWIELTDTTNQVASFSSVGNIGRGREGSAGRFKPDVVAPGTFVVSTRASRWVVPTNIFNPIAEELSFVRIRAGRTNAYQTFVPDNGIRLEVVCVPNADSPPGGLPPLPIQIRATSPPTAADFVETNRASVSTVTSVPDDWHFSVANTNSQDVYLHIRYFVTVTNDVGNEPEVLFNLTEDLDPNHLYRYESGTSMATPVVSGLLALMQEYFQLNFSGSISPAPALMKALLINGARSLGSPYSYSVSNSFNEQGWGLPNITNTLPETGLVSGDAGGNGSVVFFDQSVDRSLITGQSFTREVTLTPAAQNLPLRFTLVWTDPAGNPAVGLKLVNDLDLVVTNLSDGRVFAGNAFGSGSLFVSPVVSGREIFRDNVNNVENVFIDRRQGGRFSVTVTARRVNVNAVTAHQGGTAQDFALVISSDDRLTTSPLTVSPSPDGLNAAPLVQTVTNGIPLLNQRVGANSPLLVSTNGVTNQWRFFIVENRLPPTDPAGTNGPATNIAFATFQSPNLSQSRSNQADIDLFVSTNPAITNLDADAIAASFRGVGRGGTEAVIIPNAVSGVPYYAGVKSEDQQAASFGFFAVSSSSPFSQRDTNGNIVARGYPLPASIPDGDSDSPKAALVFAFVIEDVPIKNVVVTNAVNHEHVSDLIGVLEHNGVLSVLNNHTPADYAGFIRWVFDDSDSGSIPTSEPTHSPGTLRNFAGGASAGVWLLAMVDDSTFFSGQVEEFTLRIEPRRDDELRNPTGVLTRLPPGRWDYTPIDVPADATNLLVCVSPDEAPVEVYIGRGFFPARNDYDTFAVIVPPGDCLSLGRRDVPPLSQGRYFIGVFNPNAVPVNARIRVFVQRDLAARTTVAYPSDSSKELLDDAKTNSVIVVGRSGVIADLSVGVRIAHPRVSDLVLHLVSPQGTRLLLAENRGGPLGADYGFGALQTNRINVSSQGGPQASTNVVGPVETEGVLQVDYQFFGVPDQMTVYYDNILIFDSGLISGSNTVSIPYGPGASTNLLIVMNEGTNPNAGTRWEYRAIIVSGYIFATFTDNTNLASAPIKFAVPPFTNFNYSVTNYVTNATVLNDGFEAGAATFNNFVAGNHASGWLVEAGDVDTLSAFGTVTTPPVLLPHTGDRFLDISGFGPGTISTNFPTTPGSNYRVSFVYAHNWGNPNPTTADVIVADGSGITITSRSVVANPANPPVWLTDTFTFTAATATTTLRVDSTTPGPNPFPAGASAVFFDTFTVEQVTEKIEQGIYYQPEEPITEKPFGKLVGENALGTWTLEIWDNRVGGALTNGSLLAWKLNITYVNTNPPTVTLTNNQEYCSTLLANETAYFLINAPISAGSATNFVTASQDVDLLYNGVGLPVGQEPPDTVFLNDVPGGIAILDGGGWRSFDLDGSLHGASFTPQLQPGRRYYFAVRNRFPGTNAFCVRVGFDSTSSTLVPITHLDPTNNNGCALGIVDASGVTYYSFDVGSNAIGADFSVTNIFGTADLYVKRGLPVPRLPNQFSAASTNSGAADEFIQVADFTGALLPGRWYLAVIGAVGTSFQVCAREIPGPVIPLTPGVPYPDRLTNGEVRYYKVVISSNAFAADFKTILAGGNVDLFISTNTLIPLVTAPTNALDFATTPGGNETITRSVFDTSLFLTPGTWYLAVVNRELAPVNYQVQVIEYTLDIPYIPLVSGVPYTNTVGQGTTNQAGFYRFDVSPDPLQAVFEVFGATNDVDLYIRWGFPLPPPTNRFDFASTNLPSANKWIALVAGDTNRLLRPGSYWIAVVPKIAATGTDYRIRATQILRSEAPRLFSGIDICTIIPPVDINALHRGAHFYRFDVGSNAVQARLETTGTNGNVDLYLQYGLPITNYSLLIPPSTGNFVAQEGPAANETICLRTNDTPVALRPGSWYVAVVNRETNHVNYCIRASVVEVVPLADGVAQCGSLNLADGSTVNGIHYYSFTVATNAVQAVFEAYSVSNNVDLYLTKPVGPFDCGNFPGALTNFLVAGTNAGVEPELICLITNSPVALSAGEWLLAVVNRETNFAGYCVRASQLLDTDFLRVTNRAQYCPPTLGVGNGALNTGIDYYIVTVTNDPVLLTLETFNASGNVDLYVGQVGTNFCVPNFASFDSALTNYPYASEHLATAPECVTLGTNTVPVVLTNGEWYVAVVNRDPTNVSYCFLATQFTNDPNVRLTNNLALCGESVPPTNLTAGVGVNYYVVNISSNALQASFEVYNANGNVDLYLQNGFCFPNRDTFNFTNENAAYWSINTGTNAELFVVHTGSFPVALQPGEWNLAVVSRETNDVTFCVRVREWLDSDVIRLTNAAPYGGTVAAVGSPAGFPADYYVFNVSTGAVRAQFEILTPSGNVNLVARKGLPLPSLAGYDYASTNAGTGAELIVLDAGSAPVRLSPGDWYLAVLNTTASPVSYEIVATEYFSAGTNVVLGGISITTNNQFCLTWNNMLPGVNYYVEGKASLNAQAWVPVSGTLRATNNSVSWCLQLPSPYSFFRLAEGLSPLSASVPLNLTGVTSGPGGTIISWTAPANQRYVAEWSNTLFPPSWQPYPDYVPSVGTSYTFTDDGSLTGGLPPNRFYRFFLLP